MGFPTEVTEEKCKIILGIKSSNRDIYLQAPILKLGPCCQLVRPPLPGQARESPTTHRRGQFEAGVLAVWDSEGSDP